MNTLNTKMRKPTEKKSSANVFLILAVCYLIYICFELAKGLAFDASMPVFERTLCILSILAFLSFSIWKALSTLPRRKEKASEEACVFMDRPKTAINVQEDPSSIIHNEHLER